MKYNRERDVRLLEATRPFPALTPVSMTHCRHGNHLSSPLTRIFANSRGRTLYISAH